MLRDMGFSHAIAKAVLEDNPRDAEALKVLERPENRIVYNDGTEIDLSEIDEETAIRNGLQREMRMRAFYQWRERGQNPRRQNSCWCLVSTGAGFAGYACR